MIDRHAAERMQRVLPSRATRAPKRRAGRPRSSRRGARSTRHTPLRRAPRRRSRQCAASGRTRRRWRRLRRRSLSARWNASRRSGVT
ncbi:hypothetical protein FBR04_12145 [Betaproteobacteria bacterium PRO7]|nr:hypothetical protein [Betaproteobacteria bacterium PRO7]